MCLYVDVGQAPLRPASCVWAVACLHWSTREAGHKLLPAWQNTGRHGVEGKGKLGGLSSKACSLCCSFPLKIQSILSQVKNNSALAPPSFKGCHELSAKRETAKQNEACKDQTSFSQAQSTLMPTTEATQYEKSGQWGQISSLTNSILILFSSLLELCFVMVYVDHFS